MPYSRGVILFTFLALIPAAPAAPPACATLPPASSPSFEPKLESFMNAWCYRIENWNHDLNVRTSDGVHPFVKIYYSPALWNWLTTGGRKGDVPDGAMLVKEQYTKITGKQPDEWTIMVKDHTGSFDGWYWADLSAPSTPVTPPPACSEPLFPYVGFGQYCINCHASAADGQSTYASTQWTKATTPAVLTSPSVASNIHHRIAMLERQERRSPGPSKALANLSRIPSGVFANIRALPPSPVPCMVSEAYDHVVSGGKPAGPEQFLTSDQCMGCHDATGTLSGANRGDIPSMLWPNAQASSMVNVSPYGEWRYSMMGLSGRDPIFFAQLDSETTIHANLKDHPNDAQLYIEDLCLRCHGVMGERQYNLDTGKLFPRSELLSATSKYGALGRDGVSCTACHHIAAEGLGKPETFTGEFKVGPPTEMYGPFQDVITYPMKSGVGIEPKSTDANQIQSSALCGSCHTIVLPVYDAQGNRVMENGKPAVFYEQDTYLEWLNSAFQNEYPPYGTDKQTCQDCHMPSDYQGNKLSYKVANIEDNTFPAVTFRAPDTEITMKLRDPFYRHTLLGINLFALQMFGQFRVPLGLYQTDPMLPNPGQTKTSHATAVASSLELATAKSAQLNILSARKANGNLEADVEVVNLAGHSFPSGVGFRRAFVKFELLGPRGDTLWVSGNTSSEGIIVDTGGKPLITEFFSPQQQQFQVHRWAGNPITADNQVQIYEELVQDPQHLMTTSFLSLYKRVKDNRLQPKGWSPNGRYANETRSVGTGADPSYGNGKGSSVVSYRIPLNAKTLGTASVRATLFYQTIPPYFLRQRSETGHGPDAQRLVQFVQQLNVAGTPVANWRLQIATKTGPVQ